MINLVTVCTDKYPIIYAEKLHKQFTKLSNLEVTHYCITDRPDELPNFIKPIYPFKKSKGWWNKLNLFSGDMPAGSILYMDIDIVILQNFDDFSIFNFIKIHNNVYIFFGNRKNMVRFFQFFFL